MNVGEQLVAFRASLRTLEGRAEELAQVALDPLGAGGADRSGAARLVNSALADAERAAELAVVAELPSAAVDQVRLAGRMLEHATLDQVALRDLGVRLRSHVITLRGDDVAAELRPLILRPAADLDANEWRRLGKLGTHAGIPEVLAGSDPFHILASRLSTGPPRAADLRHGQRYLVAARLAETPPDVVAAEVEAFARKGSRSMSQDDWIRLSAMLDSGIDTGIPPEVIGLHPLDRVARSIAVNQGEWSPKVQEYFRAFELAKLGEGAQAKLVESIMARPTHDLHPATWSELVLLLSIGTKFGSKPLLDDLATFDAVVLRLLDKKAPWEVWTFAAAFRRDPIYLARIDKAVASIMAGRLDPSAVAHVADHWHRISQLVDGRPSAERAAIAEILLDGQATSRSTQGLVPALRALRGSIPGAAELPAAFAKLRSDTIDMLDINLSRLSGRTPPGQVAGYRWYPDYAEIGRARANAQLLQAAGQLRSGERAASPPAAPGSFDW